MIQATIINSLVEADLVIADLTEHNPNVLFELGVRMAQERPVVLIRALGTPGLFDVDNLLRVFEYNPNLWPTTVEKDMPNLELQSPLFAIMAENKTKPTQVSANDYVDALTDEVKRSDSKKLIELMQQRTGEAPKMWGPSIIGFGSFHYQYETGREGDMPVVAFSPRKAALVIYGMNSFPEAAALAISLGKCKLEGSCLHIKKLADIDLNVLDDMIAKSTAARLKDK